jgi:hypothetical protein
VQQQKLAATSRATNGQSEAMWRLETVARRKLARDLGADYFPAQTFVPAGRSFFTSIGKAVAAFEQGGLLDPVTVRFGRFFTFLRERGGRRYLNHESTRQSERKRNLGKQLEKLFFGGEIRIRRDDEYIESADGRKLSFSLLSSGQQELLPLWMVLEWFIDGPPRQQLLYIEEQEAHLFPNAQNKIIEYLSTLLNISSSRLHVVIILYLLCCKKIHELADYAFSAGLGTNRDR